MQAILERADKREQLKQREAKKWDSELYILENELKMQHHAIEHHGKTAAAGDVGAEKSSNLSSLQFTAGPANDQSLQMYAPADVYLGNGNFLARWWPLSCVWQMLLWILFICMPAGVPLSKLVLHANT